MSRSGWERHHNSVDLAEILIEHPMSIIAGSLTNGDRFRILLVCDRQISSRLFL